mgnify:CR=1 FL=1
MRLNFHDLQILFFLTSTSPFSCVLLWMWTRILMNSFCHCMCQFGCRKIGKLIDDTWENSRDNYIHEKCMYQISNYVSKTCIKREICIHTAEFKSENRINKYWINVFFFNLQSFDEHTSERVSLSTKFN